MIAPILLRDRLWMKTVAQKSNELLEMEVEVPEQTPPGKTAMEMAFSTPTMSVRTLILGVK
jgi:hypothetical protein